MRKPTVNKDWHSAFCGATEWELNKNKKDLSYDTKHTLGKNPLEMDLLIIKKRKDAVIENEIGKIFRQHNIIEFKGDGDKLNIDVYYKVLAYACLYKSLGSHVDEIPDEEVTVTIIRHAKPIKLFKILEGKGIRIDRKYEGIYYLEGNVLFPVQIIVTKELNEKHPSFRILSRNAREEDVRRFLKEAGLAKESGEQENIEAVLQVSVNANKELYSRVREEKSMCEALKELMADVIEEEKEKTRKDTEEKTLIVVIKKMMDSLKCTAKQAMDMLKIPEEERSKYMTLL